MLCSLPKHTAATYGQHGYTMGWSKKPARNHPKIFECDDLCCAVCQNIQPQHRDGMDMTWDGRKSRLETIPESLNVIINVVQSPKTYNRNIWTAWIYHGMFEKAG